MTATYITGQTQALALRLFRAAQQQTNPDQIERLARMLARIGGAA